MITNKTFIRSLIITDDLLNAFSIISGDKHPLHTQDSYARQKGFNGRVCYGNILGLMLSSLVGMDMQKHDVMLISQTVNFRKPIYVGDTIRLQADIVQISEATGLVELKLSFRNQIEALVANGKCQVKKF